MSSSSSPSASASAFKYPSARRSDHQDTYASKKHGQIKVPDPYRWLEVPPSESQETQAFVEAQAAFTAEYLERDGDRAKLQAALEKNYDYAKFSAPRLQEDGYYYYSFNKGLDPQAQIYRIHSSNLPDVWPADATAVDGVELFLDPNRFSKDGTAALSATRFSKSGKFYAYGISRSGSDWYTAYVRETSSPHPAQPSTATQGKESRDEGRLDDVIRYVKYSGLTWSPDDRGIFYQRFPQKSDHGSAEDDKAGTEIADDKNPELMYHRLGSSQEQDIRVMVDPENPTHMFGLTVTDDGKYLILSVSKDTSPTAKTWIVEMDKLDLSGDTPDIVKDIPWVKVKDDFEGSVDYIANDGSKFWWQSNCKAPRSKIVISDLAKPEDGFADLIAEDPASILSSSFVLDNDKLITIRSRDVKDEMSMNELHTGHTIGRIGANLIGDFVEVTGRRHHTEMMFKVSGFSNPGLIYRYSYLGDGNNRSEQLFRSTVVKGLKVGDFATEQIFYPSKDGTRIPMFIVTPTGVPRGAAALLYGYGGFSIPMGPFFSTEMLTLCKSYGMRLAVANIRGGGEYGEDWHEAGTKDRKQNVFDDFQHAARYLVAEGYAAPKKIAIYGGSNGGLLTAACANQEPQLYGCVLAAVGVLDMLRFHKFTIGSAWCSDYGNADLAEDFDFIYPYSPLHNVDPEKEYPAMMLLTGDHDDRVVPLHSFKHIATLQHVLADNPNPLLLRVALKAGHGAGKSTQQRIEEAVDRWSFLSLSLGLKYRDV